MPGKRRRLSRRPTCLPGLTTSSRITNISRPTLAIFPAANKNAPAVIVSPGGGYSYVVPGKEGSDVAAWLNSVGITAMVLRYRVPNNRDGALQDVQRAISVARANAAKWNIDPKRLGVMGFSAGGNLSAKASSDCRRTLVFTDRLNRQTKRASRFCDPDLSGISGKRREGRG